MLARLLSKICGSSKCQNLIIWFLLGLGLFLLPVPLASPVQAIAPTAERELPADLTRLSLVEQGQVLYTAGQYHQAIKTLQPALLQYQARQDWLRIAMVYNNLALAYQQLGQYAPAQANIRKSLKLITNAEQSLEKQMITAQALELQGNLDLHYGKAQSAWDNWEQAATIYQALEAPTGVVRSRLNQAQALQVLGFYRRGIKTLEAVAIDLLSKSDRPLGWRSLGNAYLTLGELSQAENALQTSLKLARDTQNSQELGAIYFSLGNLARAQQNYTQAQQNYQQAIATAPDLEREIRARLNLLRVQITNQQEVRSQLQQIPALLSQLPLSRFAVDAKVNYAQSIFQLESSVDLDAVESMLNLAIAESRQLEDRLAEAYSLQSLGRLYELQGKLQPASELTQQVIYIAQDLDAKDVGYQGQWQLGRIWLHQGESIKAIAAYQQAVELLQSLRSDLVAVSSEVQFNFRESVEPIYREYVSLLLDSPQPKPQNLIAARNAIDALQLVELENFFHATCLDAQPVIIDNLIERDDTTTAIIYPIVLRDRFEIILKLPQQPLRHYTTPIDNPERVERILQRLPQTLTQRNSREILPLAQLVYDWLIEPTAADLAASQVNTLVFVLDSPLRNIPMSVLHDGQQYLIEKYAVAITPGLQLIQPQAIVNRQLKALTAGLSAARAGFPPLEYVEQELATIQSQITSTQQLVNRNFTNEALQQQIATVPFPIIHLATHGQFSSQAEDTFILTWDDRLNVNQLSNLLQSNQSDRAIELLVLSACETLTGDRRAALGLAGVAVKAGARSTLATLWRINDEATSTLMGEFYRQLRQPNITKAEALRQAQLSSIQSDRFNSPHFWAASVLVGNWL